MKHDTLSSALMALVTFRWSRADELVDDLRDLEGAKLLGFTFSPGEVLRTLEALTNAGQVEHDSLKGWRKMEPRAVKDDQARMFT